MTGATDAATHETELDPFGYVADMASAVRGLHGDDDPSDPFYVFHTHYVDIVPGRVDVELTFTGLRSRKDRLVLTVHSLDRQTEALALVTTENLSLRTLAASGGTASISFDAAPDLRYAILGRTVSPCEATGTALAIRCRSDPDRLGEPRDAAVETDFRPKAMRSVATLLCDRPTSLARPMSQACTAAQLREPVFARWQATAGLPAPADRFLWERIFVLQTLSVFGVIAAKATGLGFGADQAAIAGPLAALGCRTVPAAELAAGRVAAERGAGDGDDAPPVLLPPPSALRSYDFLWSTGLCGVMPGTMDMIYLIEDSLEYLKPGGMAVHMLDTTIGCAAPPPGAGPATFDRNALCQLSLAVVGGKHEIAQMNMHTDPDDRGIKSFGVIIRKG